MQDKIKIWFPVFRIVLCIGVSAFAFAFGDVQLWNFKVWCLIAVLACILIKSIYDLRIIANRMRTDNAQNDR